MTLTDELNRLEERVVQLHETISDLNGLVQRQVALCETCRPIVTGNGRRDIGSRITALETLSSVGSKRLWALVAFGTALCTTAAGVLGSFVTSLVLSH